MSGRSSEEHPNEVIVESDPQGQVDNEVPKEKTGHTDAKNEENLMPSPQEEEAVIKKKYGGILPKKKPLISKDHERAFFDSADWALGKGAQKPKGPLEALRPKLQPTPHHQLRSRRSAYAPSDDEDMPSSETCAAEDHHDCSGEQDKNNEVASGDQNCHN